MLTKRQEKRVENLFDKGMELMRKVIAIQDKIYELDELVGEKFNEAINDESFLRLRPF